MGKTGHLTQPELKNVIDGISVDTFVETGTYLADSTLEASKIFDTIYSIEIIPALYERAKTRCANEPTIHLFLGDTVQILPTIIPKIIENSNGCVWFLDAHQSGPDTGNNGQWVPLLEEIDAILNGISHRPQAHIFIIDDVRLFSAYWDWADISFQSIEDRFKRHPHFSLQSKSVSNDRFIIKGVITESFLI